MKETDEIYSLHRVKQNGDKVFMITHWSGTVQMTIGDNEPVIISTIKTGINVEAILSLTEEEVIMLDDYLSDLVTVETEKAIKLIEGKLIADNN